MSLNSRQRAALDLVRRCETAQCVSGSTYADRYTAYVNYRTAEALRSAHLIEIGPPPDHEITAIIHALDIQETKVGGDDD